MRLPCSTSHSLKKNLIGKVQVDDKTVKQYDQAATSYRRALVSDQMTLAVKARLTKMYVQLDPVVLRQRIGQNVACLWKIVRY